MSIQSNINQGLFLGTAALGAIDKMAEEDTALAKEQFETEKGRAKKQAENLEKLSKDLTEEEQIQYGLTDEDMADKVAGGLTPDRQKEISKYGGILGEKKKQKEYLQGASLEEYNQAIYQAANHRVGDILALKEEQMKYSKATNGLYDTVSDEAKAEIRKQLGGKE